MISFCLYSTHFKVYIYLPCINTQQQTTVPSDDTSVILSSDHQKTGLYQGSADRCEGDCNSDLICLVHKYQAIHYCNQSVLDIFSDLNIFVLSITIVDIISKSALVRFSLLRASYFYKSAGLRFYIFCSEPASCLCDRHLRGLVHYIDTTKICF